MASTLVSLNPIKSDTQRALASYWDRLAAGRAFPALAEFKPGPDLCDSSELVLWNLEGEGGQLKFRAMYQGEHVAQLYNAAWSGKTMSQVIPMSLRRLALAAAQECTTSGCLVYSIISTLGSQEQRVDCERLLLPFGRGSKVEQILTSLQLKSAQAFRREKILNHFKIQADVLFSCRIKSGFTGTAVESPDTAATQPEKRRGSKSVPALARPESGGGREKRRAPRRNVMRSGRIKFGAESRTCTVRNISATGASIQGANLADIPDAFTLVLEMETAERRCSVAWRKKAQIGIRFE